MNFSLQRAVKTLDLLDKRAKELEGELKDVRIEIHNAFWDLVEMKRMENNGKSLPSNKKMA